MVAINFPLFLHGVFLPVTKKKARSSKFTNGFFEVDFNSLLTACNVLLLRHNLQYRLATVMPKGTRSYSKCSWWCVLLKIGCAAMEKTALSPGSRQHYWSRKAIETTEVNESIARFLRYRVTRLPINNALLP